MQETVKIGFTSADSVYHSYFCLYLQRNLPGANTMVHQSAGMVSGISNSYIGTTVYNAQPVAHSVQPVIASTPVSNLSDSAQILTTSLTHSNITFRQLPFYKLKYEILKPTVLSKSLHNTKY